MQITHSNDCPWRGGHDCECGALDYQAKHGRTIIGETAIMAEHRATIARLTAERDALHAEVERLREGEAETRADERAKVIKEAARSGCDWFKRESADGFEPDFYGAYVDCIMSLHTPSSRAALSTDTKGEK